MKSKSDLSFFCRLSGKFATGFCILAVLISTGTCAIGYFRYKSSVEKLYNDTAYHVARQAVSMVDGDDIKRYANTGETDGKYKKMRDEIENLREKMNVVAIFIVEVNVPKNGSYNYILDTISVPSVPHELGDSEEYDERYREFVEGCYYEGREYPDEYIYVESERYGKNSFVMSPIYDGRGNVAAILMVQSSVELIQEILNRYLFFSVIFTVVLVALFLTIYLAYLRRTVIKPINEVAAHTSEFIEHYTGEISSSLTEVKTGDEIGILTRSIIKMETDIRNYVNNLEESTAAREHMAAEFGIARKIQEDLFPCTFPAFPERRDFDIYVKLSGCDVIGGNFYNFFLTEGGRLVLLLGDVSQNGIPTAMFSIIAHTIISSCAADEQSPAGILEEANNRLSKDNNAHRTADVFLGIVNLSTGLMSYSAAGEMNIFIKHSGEGLTELPQKEGIPLAVLEQAAYSNREIYLSQGDLLWIMTAGAVKTVDTRGDILGKTCVMEKLEDLVRREYSLKNMAEEFWEFIDGFRQGAEQSADSTVFLFRYIGGL